MDIPSYLLGKKAGGGGKGNLRYVVVDELPTTGENNVIYLVPKDTSGTNNYYDEYMYINSAWELIGDTVVDLTDYVKNTDYATSSKGGVIKPGHTVQVNQTTGVLSAEVKDYSNYQAQDNYIFISKGTLENVIAGKGLQTQLSTMPTASASNLDKIVQYTGTTDSTYTNGYFYKCVSDGASTPTYSWEEVEVQAGGGGASYTAGTNIEITNAGVINNTIPYVHNSNNGFGIGNNLGALPTRSGIVIGDGATTSGMHGIAIGTNAMNNMARQCTIGGTGSDNTINQLRLCTSDGFKIMATEDYVDNAISTAITSALGGNY